MLTQADLIGAVVDGSKNGLTYSEVAKLLNCSKSTLQQRCSKLRSNGIPLPTLGRTKVASTIDVEGGLELLAELTGKTVAMLTTEGKALQKNIQQRTAQRQTTMATTATKKGRKPRK